MATNILTQNKVIQLFREWAAAKAPFINGFGYGPLSDIATSTSMQFPYMWIDHRTSSLIQIANFAMAPTYSYNILFVDQINIQKNVFNENGNPSDNRADIMSDTFQLGQDFINDLKVNYEPLGIILNENIQYFKFEDETTDKVCGWIFAIDLQLEHYTCSITSLDLPSSCSPAKIINSDESFSLTVQSGSLNTLEDIIVTVGGGAVINKPAAVDINLQDYYYAVNPTGTRVPQTIPIQNGNTQVPWLSGLNVTTGLGSITKTSGGVDWNAQGIFIISTLGDFEVEWKVTSGTIVMAGLNYVDASADFGDLDFSFYNTTNGNYDIRENGTSRGGVGLINVNDVLSIKRQGFQILYKINGTTVYVSNVIASSNALSRGYMLFDNSILTQGGGLTNVKLTYL